MRTMLISRKHAESDWLGRALSEVEHNLQYVDNLRDGIFLAGLQPFDFIITMALDPRVYCRLFAAMQPLSLASQGAALIVLLGPATAQDRVRMLRGGADACLSRPHSLLELHERLNVLRRTRLAQESDGRAPQRRRPWLDATTREFVFGLHRMEMTRREYAVMECLLREPSVPVSRERLIADAWPEALEVGPENVNFIVSRLRRKLARALPEIRIETVSRFGYRIVLPATEVLGCRGGPGRTPRMPPSQSSR